jgi:hypothetical protein
MEQKIIQYYLDIHVIHIVVRRVNWVRWREYKRETLKHYKILKQHGDFQ